MFRLLPKPNIELELACHIECETPNLDLEMDVANDIAYANTLARHTCIRRAMDDDENKDNDDDDQGREDTAVDCDVPRDQNGSNERKDDDIASDKEIPTGPPLPGWQTGYIPTCVDFYDSIHRGAPKHSIAHGGDFSVRKPVGRCGTVVDMEGTSELERLVVASVRLYVRAWKIVRLQGGGIGGSQMAGCTITFLQEVHTTGFDGGPDGPVCKQVILAAILN